MADPISVMSLVEGSIGLVLQCGSVAKTLSDMIAKFKQAGVAITSLIQEVETIQFAWSRIKEWSEDHAEAATDSQFVQRLEKSLECGTLILSALEQDLADYKDRADNASFVRRSKMAWNERAFLDHQHRVRGQVQAMTLLLQVSQLSTSKAQTKLLKKKEKAFKASDESAYSIVPSRMSSHMSMSTRSQDSVLTIESQELVYYPFSFEDDLFTARVYKRNYRNPWIKSLVNLHWGKKREERRVPTAKPETPADGQSLLSLSTGTYTPTIVSVDVSQSWPSNQEIPLEDLRPVLPGPALTAETKADPTDLEGSVEFSGSVQSTLEQSPRTSSGLRDRPTDSSVNPMHPAEGQSDISATINPAPGDSPHMNKDSNRAVGRPSPASEAQYEMNRSLLLAVKEGNLDAVGALIHQGAEVNPQRVFDEPPLHLAVCRRDVSMTELLLQEGANYARGWRRTLPIHQACKVADIRITRMLLDAGASASSLDAQEEQPLHKLLSTKSPRFDASGLIGLLVSRGADINARTPTGKTPLHLSCEHDNVDNVRALLALGTDPNSIYNGGRTAFHTLVGTVASSYTYHEYQAIFRLLHDHGTDVNAEDRAGDTPLHVFARRILFRRPYALKAEHVDFFELFLVNGARVDAQNRLGNTPFHILATFWNRYHHESAWFKAIMGLSLQHGFHLDAQNRARDTPLHIMVTNSLRHADAIQLLLEHGANVNAQNEIGDLPLHILLRAGLSTFPRGVAADQAILKSLIKHGAYVNIQDMAGDTPLHIVSRCDINAEEKSQLIRRLLDAGADRSVNIQNVAGDTPLHILAGRSDLGDKNAEWGYQLIRWLLDAGADLDIRNLRGVRAWQLLGPNHRSVIRPVAQARSPQESMSEGDEDETGVAS